MACFCVASLARPDSIGARARKLTVPPDARAGIELLYSSASAGASERFRAIQLVARTALAALSTPNRSD